MLKRLMRTLLYLAVIFSVSGLCAAQQATGNISGTVRDSTGAVISGATVEAQNVNTGEKRSTTASDQGFYQIPNLSPGVYNVTATGQGFAPSTVKDVNVSVAFTVTQDMSLNAAGSQEAVTVSTGDAQTALNTSDQQLSTLINNQKIIDLPLLSRDPNSLVLLAPGTTASSSRLGGFQVNGQRERNNNFLVDGIDNN